MVKAWDLPGPVCIKGSAILGLCCIDVEGERKSFASPAWISSKPFNEMALNELTKAGSCEELFYS